jgi:hypothetical protein
MPLVRATALWIPNTGPAHDPERGHLYVVLTNTCVAGRNLIVPICSQHDKCDTTCLIGIGDHSFIKHASFVMYAKLEIVSADTILQKISSNQITDRGQFDAKAFAYVCAGIENSRKTKPSMKKYFADQCN